MTKRERKIWGFIVIGLLLSSCAKDELPTPMPQHSTIEAVALVKDTFVPDTIIPYEYYTRTTYFSSIGFDGVWADTIILQVLTLTINEWLIDGHYFVEDRKDTLIVLPTNPGISFSDYWHYWYLDD